MKSLTNAISLAIIIRFLIRQTYETSKYYWGLYTYYQGLPVHGHWIRMYCEMKTVYAPFQILGLEHSKFVALVDND